MRGSSVLALGGAMPDRLGAVASVPGYDRSQVTVGVVHVGVGGFHRAHQAVYLDRLMEETGDLRWGICGVGVLPGDAAMRDALEPQDGLYTVIERQDDEERLRVVGSLVEYLLAPDDPERVVERMAAETTRIVSLTVTEGGYATADADPGSAFGLIAEALNRRRRRGVAPFAVVSCDNLPGNGAIARDACLAVARQSGGGEDLADWIAREVAFPGSMVDRITPQTTDDDRAELLERHGIEDRWPVVCEPFTQWVLEDDLGPDRPPLERVGVQLVDDVEPYELMKLRLLNASHQALGHFGALLGHELVHDAARDPLLRPFVRDYMDLEATPTLPAVPGIDLEDYKATLLERFANAGVRDTVARLAAHASDRIPAWLLPVIRHGLEHGGEVHRSAAVVAAWAAGVEAADELDDARADALMARARRQRTEPTAFLEDRELFGSLADDERFTTPYTQTQRDLHEHGARTALERLAGRHHG